MVTLMEVISSASPGFASGKRDINGIIQVRMNNVSTQGYLNLDRPLRVPFDEKQIAKYSLLPDDILFNITNSPDLVGKTVIFKGHPEPILFSNHFLRIRADRVRLNPVYLKLFLLWHFKRRTFENMATQWVNQATVRKDDLLDLTLELPPLAEQNFIAQRLERADRLRRLRQHALTIGDQYLQNVFLEMFGDPETNPKGWEISTLDDMDADFRYGTSKKSDYTPVGVPVLRIPNVLNRHIDLTDLKYSELEGGEERRLILQRGDILFVRTNGNPDYVGRCTVFDTDEKFVYASYLIRARISPEEINPWFLEAFLQHQEGRKKMLPFIRTTAGQSNISVEGLGQIPVPRPPLDHQQQYALVVRKHERLRRMQVEALRQAEQLYETLLEEAFGRQN